jgi:hypothetical protein
VNFSFFSCCFFSSSFFFGAREWVKGRRSPFSGCTAPTPASLSMVAPSSQTAKVYWRESSAVVALLSPCRPMGWALSAPPIFPHLHFHVLLKKNIKIQYKCWTLSSQQRRGRNYGCAIYGTGFVVPPYTRNQPAGSSGFCFPNVLYNWLCGFNNSWYSI